MLPPKPHTLGRSVYDRLACRFLPLYIPQPPEEERKSEVELPEISPPFMLKVPPYTYTPERE
jgi:hypothetical protein